MYLYRLYVGMLFYGFPHLIESNMDHDSLTLCKDVFHHGDKYYLYHYHTAAAIDIGIIHAIIFLINISGHSFFSDFF